MTSQTTQRPAHRTIRIVRIIRTAALTSSIGLLLSCAEPAAPPLKGYLYFGAGYYLGRLDLATGESEYVANLGEVTVTQIDNLQDGTLLLSLRHDRVTRGQDGIVVFDLDTQISSRWLIGRAAQYLPENDTVVYDDGQSLKVIPRRGRRSQATTVLSHSVDSRVDVVRISNAEFLLAVRQGDPGSGAGSRPIRRYHRESGTLEPATPLAAVCKLDGAVWLADVSRLLCLGPGDEKPAYRLVTLDGRVERPLDLPADRRFRAVTYLPDQRVIVLTESSRRWTDDREIMSVWAHSLDTGISTQVSDNQYLGRSVAYISGLD